MAKEKKANHDKGMSSAIVSVPSVPINTVKTFTPDEVAKCIRIGRARYENNTKSQVADQRYSTRFSSLDCDINGVFGEYAFLSMFGLSTSGLEDTSLCSHAKDRGDAMLPGPRGEMRKIDIKAPVGLNSRCILVKSNKTYNPPFAYCLMVLEVSDASTKSTQAVFGVLEPTPDRATSVDSKYGENTQVSAHFRGFVGSSDLIRHPNLVDRSYGSFYEYHQSRLVDWDTLERDVGASELSAKRRRTGALPSFLQ